MADTYEVEIKSLLGSRESADALVSKLQALDPTCVSGDSYKQLNHYFEGGDLHALTKALTPYLQNDTLEKLSRVAEGGQKVSIRSREMNGEVRFVVKASLGEDTSANGVVRIEIEEPVTLSLAELDELILAQGFSYQAKWSRERQEYKTGKTSVCLDKNAGYGYLAEFERVVESQDELEEARRELEGLMGTLGVSELPQDRLERMFSHYNSNWREYYGTDKIFIIT